MRFLLAILCLLAIFPLFIVFAYVIQEGLPALSFQFLVSLPQPVGEPGGGFGHAIVGSAIIILIGAVVGVPWGVATGIYLSEYRRTKTAKFLRFTTDLMTSIPSIIIGLFVYALVVIQMKGFSALAGGFSLSIIMIPTVARTTEEILKLIPDHVREAGLALGLPRWRVIIQIVLKGSISGVMTGIMLSVARVSGETAPLLFTAFNNRFWSHSLTEPIASLPVQIYTYAISPYDEWHRQAWAGAFLLVVFVFVLNLITRASLMGRVKTYD